MSITLKRLRQRAFLKTSLEEQQGRAGSGVPLRRCLGYGSQPQESVLTPSTLLVLTGWKMAGTCRAFDVLLLGIGGTVGSGLFVLTGVAASEHAG